MQNYFWKIFNKNRVSRIWLIDKKNLDLFYYIKVRDKIPLIRKKLTQIINQNIIKITNKLLNKNYKIMKQILTQLNTKLKNVLAYLLCVKKDIIMKFKSFRKGPVLAKWRIKFPQRSGLGKLKFSKIFGKITARKFTSFAMVFMMVLSLGSLSAPKEVEAALTFGSEVNYNIGGSYNGMTSGDFNNDGIYDLAFADCGGNKARVTLGLGNGVFSGTSSFTSVGTCPTSIVSADFNNDGKLDLAVGNANSGSVSVLLGNGTGSSFSTSGTYSVGNAYTYNVNVGDFNNDGKIDLAVVTGHDWQGSVDTLGIFLGTGTGTFGSVTSYTVGTQPPRFVSPGDFNNDGKTDLIVSWSGGSGLLFFNGVGNGTFSAGVAISGTDSGLTVGDFNKDGNLDFINGGASDFGVYLGVGNGTFSERNSISSSCYRIDSTDFNNDGNLDVVCGSFSTVGVSLGKGDGTFYAETTYSPVVGASGSIIAKDLNNDGRGDIVSIQSSSNTTAQVRLNTTPFYPVASANGTAQTLGAGVTSTFQVAMDEPGTIYLQKAGTGTLTTQDVASNLTGLTLTGGTISGYTFSAATKTYYGVSTDNSYVTVTPTGSGSITVNGVPNKTGVASATIGVNSSVTKKIEVKVSEVGKVDNIYTIKILQSPATSFSVPGGVVTTESGGYRTHKFTTTGTFTAGGTITGARVLVIGGAGGGGAYNGRGGNGGTINDLSSQTISSGDTSVIIGSGGYTTPYPRTKVNGTNSYFGAITGTGGATGDEQHGNAGGGANGAGVAGTSGTGGLGAPGVLKDITGTSIAYAKGGDADQLAANGAANTANGGGSCADNCDAIRGIGGTGVVIIKFAVPTQTPTLATPTFTQTYGTNTASVTISGPVGSTIYYTTDGTDPTISSSVYSTPITVGAQIVKAMAVKSGSDNSAIGVVSYTNNWTTEILNLNAFVGQQTAVAATSYFITVPTANLINDGAYNIVGVNQAGRTSTAVTGKLIVDKTPPVITATAPATGALINSAKVSYTLDEDAVAGSGSKITFTRTGGTADPDIHTCLLSQSVLSSGEHNNTILNGTNCDVAMSLVSGAIYTVRFDFKDEAGNAATAVENTGVTVDTTRPTVTSFTYANYPNSAVPAGHQILTATFSEALLSAPTINVNQSGTSDISSATMTLSTGNTYTYDYLVYSQSLPQYQDGTATITFGATDLASNVLDTQPSGNSFIIDTIPPTIDSTISVSQRLKNPTVTTSNVRLSKTGNIYLVLNGQTPANQAAIDSLVTAKNAYKVVTGATANTLYTITTPSSTNLNDGVYNFVAVSTVGNVSAPYSTWQLTVDNTAPAITVSSNATSAGILKIGDIITFTITPTPAELNATVNSVSYNGKALTWSTLDSGVTYTSTYLVESGHPDQTSALQLTGVTLTDSVGNVSASTSSTNVVKTIDANAPTNQNSVFTANTTKKGGVNVAINSSGDITNNVWFAPAGTTTFVENSTTITKAANGTSIGILSPTVGGDYKLFITDAAGNYSTPTLVPEIKLIVDASPPGVTLPNNIPQILKAGDTSTSTVGLTEDGNIYMVESGTTVTTQTEISNAIGQGKAFLVNTLEAAQAGTPYLVTIPTGLTVDGAYKVLGVDTVGNVSTAIPSWLTIDNTAPVTQITDPTEGQLVGSLPEIFGDATIEVNSIASTMISIKDLTTGFYYDGITSKTFVSNTEANSFFPVTAGGNSTSWSLDTTGVIGNTLITWAPNTSYLLKTRGTDGAGNIENVINKLGTTFTIDNVAPVSTVISPSDGSSKNALTLITGTSIDGGIVALTEISIERLSDNKFYNGTTFSPTSSTFLPVTSGTSDWSYTITSDKFTTNTQYRIKARGTDDAGNVEVPASSVTFIYDTSTPSSTITPICSTTGNSCTAEGALLSPQGSYNVSKIEGTTSDVLGGSGVSSVMISIKDTSNTGKWYDSNISSFNFGTTEENYLSTDVVGNSWSFNSLDVPFEIQQTYEVHIKAIDAATNEESPVQLLQFQITNNPPEVSAVSASQQNSAGEVTVTFNTSDRENDNFTTNSLFYKVGATLSEAITSTSNSLSVSSGTNFADSGIILIDNEMISYASKSGTLLSGLARHSGVHGLNTTAISHDAGAQIYMYAASATGDVGLQPEGSGTIIWRVRDDAVDGYQSSSGVLKVVANDGAVGSMIGSGSSATVALDAAKPIVNTDSLLINDSAVDYVGISPDITLKLQNVTGVPTNENVTIQFSINGTWYGANVDHTLTEAGSGSVFASDSTTLNSLYWNWTMTSRTATIQVKITDSYGNVSEIDTNNVSYNARPEFDTTDGLTVSQISDAGVNFAKLKIDYKIRDTDNTAVTPTFSYDIDGDGSVYDYLTIDNTDIEGLEVSGTNTVSGTYTTYTVYWTPTADISTTTASFKVLIDDLETSTNTAEKIVSNLIIDKKSPIVIPTSVIFDAGVAGETNSGLVTITLPSDVSAVSYKIWEEDTGSDTGWQTLPSSTTIPWTFDIDVEVKTLKYQFKDLFGNITTEAVISTLAPIEADSFLIQDASNPNIPTYDMYIGWGSVPEGTTGFASYKLEYATSLDNSVYGSYAPVVDVNSGMLDTTTNYYVHRNLDPTKFYKYRLGVTGTNGNTSVRAGAAVTAKPDGVQNYGEGGGGGSSVPNASQVENVVPRQGVDKQVTVTYRVTDASISKKINPTYEGYVFYNIGVTLPTSGALSGDTLTVSNGAKLKSSGYVQINNEVIKYTSKTGNVLSGLTRGTWPTVESTGRATRQNSIFFAGTPVWIMANGTTPIAITNSTISSGQNGSINWNTYNESGLAGSTYNNVGIRVLVHDNQGPGSGPLSTQSDYSEIGTLDTMDLSAPTVTFSEATSSGLQSVPEKVFTINLSRAYPIASVVDYNVTGTAISPDDYTLPSGQLTFAVGEVQKTLTATIVDHATIRANKTIIITLLNPVDATLGANPSQTYTIINHEPDTTPPTVTLEGLNPMYVLSGTTFNDPGATASDLVDGIITSSIVVTNLPNMEVPSATPYSVIYTATDSSGNTGTAIRDVYVDDANSATFDIIATQGTNGAITPEGTTTLNVHSSQTYTITANEGYKVEGIIVDGGAPITPTLGVNTYTFTDVIAPHAITATFVALPDTTKPTITMLGLATVPVTLGDTYTDAGATAEDTYLGVTTDLTSGIDVVSSVNTQIAGSYKVKYTVADNAGNIQTATRTVNVSTNETYTITATAGANGTITPIGPTSVNTGSNSTFTITPESGYQIATLTVDGVGIAIASSYTFTSVTADHTISATFVASSDTTKPTITLLGLATVPLTVGDTYVDAGATAEDTYLGVTTDLTSSIVVVGIPSSPVAFGTYTIMYTVSDAAGNTQTATRTVNVTYNATYSITASVTGGNGTISPSGVTSVNTNGSVIYTIAPDDGYQTATLTVDGVGKAIASTYTFSNVSADHTINVTFSAMSDTTKPTITLLGLATVPLTVGDTYTDAGAEAEDTYLGVTTDLTSSIVVVGIPSSPVAFGTYTIMYTVSDAAGNTQTATRTVNVTYNETYTITPTAGANGSISPSVATSVLSGENKTFTITPDSGYVISTLTVDNVGIAITSSYTFFDVFADHTIDVTFSNAIDRTPPVITLAGDASVTVERDSSPAYIEPGVSAFDAVDGVVDVETTGAVTMSSTGIYTLTYTARDLSGNVATKTRTVNVVLANSYSITATAGLNGTIVADDGAVMSAEGVTVVPKNTNQIYTITPSEGYAVETLVVDDVNQNPNTEIVGGKYSNFTNVTSNHTIHVTFTNTPDVDAPVITLTQVNGLDAVTVIKDSGAYADAGATILDVRDGTCTLGDTSVNPTSGTCVYSTSGIVNTTAVSATPYTFTYTARDSSGMVSSLSRLVTVSYASTYTITVTSGSHGSISPTTGPFASQTNHTFSIAPEDVTYRVSSLIVDDQAVQEAETYTFTNLIANHSIAATFSLVDAVKPTITLNMPELNPMTINSGTTFVDPGAVAVDSSQRVVEVVASGNVNTSTAGSYTITYTATDIDGVVATATRTVIVQDITAPTILDIAVPVITQTAAAITWTTNEPATSQVIWGTETGVLTNTTTKDNTLSIYHVVTLSNLTENIPYFFKVISEDSSTNSATSDPESTFTTVPTTTVIRNTHTTNNPANDNTSKFVPDTIAPKITDYKIYDISAFEAKVSFSTDEETLSFAEYGKTNSYGENSANNLWSKDHIINLRGLKFGTDYHVKVTAVDKAGNASSTEDKVFKTKFFSENPDDLTKIDNVEQFQNEIESTIESILPALIPPFIEEPKVIDISENSATITYRTNIKAYPVVGYIEESAYDATKANPYLIETSDTTAKSFEHTLKLLNLRPNMLYHLQARAFSLPQVVGKSGEITFTTKASKIKGSIIQKRKDSFVVVWTTDEPTSSIVEYKNIKTGEVSRIIDSVNKISTHSVKAENLIPGTTYEVKISGINARGNVVEGAEVLKVTTLVDVTPPIIASFKVESSLVSGRTDRAQSIVSWQTDEPSTSIVYYEEGSGSPDKPLANKQQDTTTLVTNHVVILSTLKPGTIYRFQIASKDDAGNTAKLPIRTIITPRQNESIVDVIFKNFDQTFNFLKNVK
jgi:hypothetical protein